ncbi:MAG: hypothetical protein ACT4ON_15350 [Bacteroidota bacterium]
MDIFVSYMPIYNRKNNRMRIAKIIAAGILLCTQCLFSQTVSDYIISKKNDTVPISVEKWNNTRIISDVNGVRTKYKAKQIKEYKISNVYGESARICPPLIGIKKWMFLERIVSGKINIYTIEASERSLDSKTGNNTGNYLTDYSHTYSEVTIYYIRKKPDGKYKKLYGYGKLRKMASDCPTYIEKHKNSDPYYPYIEEAEFYNNNCK